MTNRLWFKIGEAARIVGVTAKDLRYWEQVIPELKPRRSKGNLRYYHADELPRLKQIRGWLAEGLTVADCRQLLLHGHLTPTLDLGLEASELPTLKVRPRPTPKANAGLDLKPIVKALRELLERLDKPVKLR